MPHMLMVSLKELTSVLDGGCQNSTCCCPVRSPTVTDTVRLLPVPVHVFPSTQFFPLCIDSPGGTAVSHPPSALQMRSLSPFLSMLDCPSLHVRCLPLEFNCLPANIDSKYSAFFWAPVKTANTVVILHTRVLP